MGLIFGWSYDSNTQLTSFVKSESSQSLEREECNPKEMLAIPIRRNTPSRFMVMKYNKIVLPTYHPEGFWDDQDANLTEIKFCGFGKCPNRYGYITRPDVLKNVFRVSD